jgi:membrane-associated phospholipid phosphatase
LSDPVAASSAHVTGRNVAIAGGITVAAVVLLPFDASLSRRLRSPDLQRSTVWHNGALLFDWYGAPGAMYAGPLLALAGSAWRSTTASDVGIHITESYATAAVVTFAIKGLAGRARPYTYALNQETAYSFKVGRGFPHREPFSSFPSGHATGSFAFASAITLETARHWPRHALLVGTLAYGGALLDGVSRVYRDTHWPSDVAVGALVGTMSGLLVTHHQHSHPDNRLDALARRVTIAPSTNGKLLLGVARAF